MYKIQIGQTEPLQLTDNNYTDYDIRGGEKIVFAQIDNESDKRLLVGEEGQGIASKGKLIKTTQAPEDEVDIRKNIV